MSRSYLGTWMPRHRQALNRDGKRQPQHLQAQRRGHRAGDPLWHAGQQIRACRGRHRGISARHGQDGARTQSEPLERLVHGIGPSGRPLHRDASGLREA